MTERLERWTQATVHPDMWADPADDPRNSEGTSPDGELATLEDYLANYRLTLRMKCEGLDAEQLARRSVPPSTMSLLGLVRHLARVERDWRNWITEGEPLAKLYGARDADFDGAVADPAVVEAAWRDLEREQVHWTPSWPPTRIWGSGSAGRASRCGSCRCTASRSTPATAGTPTCCASAWTAGWASDARRGGGHPGGPDGPQDTPHGSLHVIEGPGHMPHEEQPAAFNRLLRAVVREMAGAAV